MSDSTEIKSRFVAKRDSNRHEKFIHGMLFNCAGISVLTTVGIIIVLMGNAVYSPGKRTAFFEEVSVTEFLTDTKWKPEERSAASGSHSAEADWADNTARPLPGHFGILPLLSGTMMVALIASVVSVP
ncbi:MAG: hypothetical protein KDA91_22975, partial [Planctomycetaceae bacterium]|nr:hypothetical protein [Planctomycetaceae bacterium]